MSRQMTIAREGSISMGGFVYSQLVRFGFNLVAARVLGVEALGVYALVVALLQVGEVLATGGLDVGLLRFGNQKEGEERRQIIAAALKRASLSAMVIGLLIVLFAAEITRLLHGGALLRVTLISAGAALPFSAMTIMLATTAQAWRRLLPKVVATQMIQPTVFLLAMVLGGMFAGREMALALPFLIAPVMAFFWLLPKIGRLTELSPMEVLRARGNRELTAYAMPLLAVSLFSMLSHWIDIVMLGLLSDVHSVGLYQPAARTAGLLRSVLLAFTGIAAPMLAEYHGRQDGRGVRDTYAMVNRWILMIVMVPFLVLVLFPGEILSVFGKGFGEGARAMVILAVSALLLAWFGLGSTVLAMCGGERFSLMNQAGALALQALLHWLLIPRLGIDGAALSTLFVMIVLTCVRMVELRFLLNVPFVSVKFWKPLVAGAVAGGFMVAVRLVAGPALPPLPLLLVATVAGMFVYASLIRAFRLEREELEVILKFMPFLNTQSKNKAP